MRLTQIRANGSTTYERELKRLAKRWPNVRADCEAAFVSYQANGGVELGSSTPSAAQIPSITPPVAKVRVASRDMKRGKSGGFRVLLALHSATWLPFAIYAKSDEASLPMTAVIARLKHALAEAENAEGE